MKTSVRLSSAGEFFSAPPLRLTVPGNIPDHKGAILLEADMGGIIIEGNFDP
jgi:hypothetical protein